MNLYPRWENLSVQPKKRSLWRELRRKNSVSSWKAMDLNMGRGICLTGRFRQMNLKENIYKLLCFWQVLYCRMSINVYSFVLCFVQSEFFTTDKLNAKM